MKSVDLVRYSYLSILNNDFIKYDDVDLHRFSFQILILI